MAGKILIIDASAANRIVLQVKLATACYRTLQAETAQDAMRLIRRHRPDLVILSHNLPDMDSHTLCRRLKASEETQSLAVVMLAADQSREARLAALGAGADEVLTRPMDDMVLLARLRSLLRARDAEEELRMRDGTSRALGFAEAGAAFEHPARVVLVAPEQRHDAAWATALGEGLPCKLDWSTPARVLRDARSEPDVFVLMTGESDLRLLPDLRARSETRHAAVIVVLDQLGRRAAADALDMGANDLMLGQPELDELRLRLAAQIRRKRMTDRLRANVRDGLRAALVDPLTGLYNRRYAMPYLARVAERAIASGRDCAVMVADLDHFKTVNDRFGHAAGDAVLVEVARRLRDNVRAMDLVARIGGEEFLIVMPEIGVEAAGAAAVRLHQVIARDPVPLPDLDRSVSVTVSIGIAMSTSLGSNVAEPVPGLLAAADKALFGSKAQGRSRITLSKPAAGTAA